MLKLWRFFLGTVTVVGLVAFLFASSWFALNWYAGRLESRADALRTASLCLVPTDRFNDLWYQSRHNQRKIILESVDYDPFNGTYRPSPTEIEHLERQYRDEQVVQENIREIKRLHERAEFLRYMLTP